VRLAEFAPEHGWLLASQDGVSAADIWSLEDGSHVRSVPHLPIEGAADATYRLALSDTDDHIVMALPEALVVFTFPEMTPVIYAEIAATAFGFATPTMFIAATVDGELRWRRLPADPPAHYEDELFGGMSSDAARDGALLSFETSRSHETLVATTSTGAIRVWRDLFTGNGSPREHETLVELADGRWSSTERGHACDVIRGTIDPRSNATP
jgi:hypothetical protein